MEKIIIDSDTLKRTIRRISYEIIEKNKNIEDVVLLGIRRKGINLANIIQNNIKSIEGITLNVGEIDITPYRDDLKTDIPKDINKELVKFEIKDKIVVLIDDVLFTGRTIRAAMDAVMDIARPKRIELAILIDRGHRQLPIKANYIGKNIPTSADETVKVILTDLSPDDKVLILK